MQGSRRASLTATGGMAMAPFYLNVEHNTWYDLAPRDGQLSEMIFRGITAPATFKLPGVMNGIDADHGFTNIDTADQVRTMVNAQRPCGGR